MDSGNHSIHRTLSHLPISNVILQLYGSKAWVNSCQVVFVDLSLEFEGVSVYLLFEEQLLFLLISLFLFFLLNNFSLLH